LGKSFRSKSELISQLAIGTCHDNLWSWHL
jgi:hypothetical protein